MRSLPLRVRLTLPFALAMAGVLAALGLFVYFRVGGALLSSIDQNLHAQAAEARSRVTGDRSLLDPDAPGGSAPAEVLDAQGRVLRSSPRGLRPFLDRAALQRVLSGGSVLRSGPLPRLKHDWRLLATPVRHAGQARALVVAASLESRDETLGHLLGGMLIAGPFALLLAGLAGYGLAAAALRPVEAMRRRADAISASTPGRRLPVPAGRDELARLARTLNDMLGRLEAAFAHERRFVADASHELRTPLALLRTELELALRRPRSHEELEVALRSAAEETERLTRLAEDLLLIARADQGPLPIRREPVAVSSVLEAAAERFAATARRQNRALEHAPDEELVLDADAARLAQALGNLVENALVHGAGPVVLSARRNGDLVELHVADEGKGFPADFAARAFDRFSQADDARSGGGAGLGLAIVELIARAHGGTAGAANRDGGGADVWIAVNGGPAPARPLAETSSITS